MPMGLPKPGCNPGRGAHEIRWLECPPKRVRLPLCRRACSDRMGGQHSTASVLCLLPGTALLL